MRLAAFVTLALALVGCSREPDPPREVPLGVIVLPATDPKLGPHPDLKLSYEEFTAKHFPEDARRLREIDAKMAELEELENATRRDRRGGIGWDDPNKYRAERADLSFVRAPIHDALFHKVQALRAEMKGRG